MKMFSVPGIHAAPYVKAAGTDYHLAAINTVTENPRYVVCAHFEHWTNTDQQNRVAGAR